MSARYKLIHDGSRLLIRCIANVRMINAQVMQIPAPYIAACNHLHMLDAPLTFGNTPGQHTFVPLAAEKWKNNILGRLFLGTVDSVFINRGEVDRAALKALLAALKSGRCLGIAPEGTRSPTGGLQTGKSGVCWLARTADVPIIPFGHWGIEKARFGRRVPVTMNFGQPFRVARTDDVEAKTVELMRIIASLLPEQYRGVYA